MRKTWVRVMGWLAAMVVIVMLVGGGGVFLWLRGELMRPYEGPVVWWEVPSGASLRSVALASHRWGWDLPPWFFRMACGLRHGWKFRCLVQAGVYEILPGMTLSQILDRMQEGRVKTLTWTLPEGWTAFDVQQNLAQQPHMRGEVGAIAEGSMLPETYQYPVGESRRSMVRRAQAMMRAVAEELWASRDASVTLGSLEELVVMASIIEKETHMAEERAMIAGVFYGRLRLGMPLQADPTVAYGLTMGAPLGRLLTRSDLKDASPYNTYRWKGLPPGPIAMPGRASLEAAAHPAATKALYFVARGDGSHRFAETLKEHLAHTRAWKQSKAISP